MQSFFLLEVAYFLAEEASNDLKLLLLHFCHLGSATVVVFMFLPLVTLFLFLLEALPWMLRAIRVISKRKREGGSVVVVVAGYWWWPTAGQLQTGWERMREEDSEASERGRGERGRQ